ncbi:hypothetical protein QUF63_13985, partial [Anaerolineales bacterium HSG25]|nr:hypothetical protein [Anaerolineales bacterium HSG25]
MSDQNKRNRKKDRENKHVSSPSDGDEATKPLSNLATTASDKTIMMSDLSTSDEDDAQTAMLSDLDTDSLLDDGRTTAISNLRPSADDDDDDGRTTMLSDLDPDDGRTMAISNLR